MTIILGPGDIPAPAPNASLNSAKLDPDHLLHDFKVDTFSIILSCFCRDTGGPGPPDFRGEKHAHDRAGSVPGGKESRALIDRAGSPLQGVPLISGGALTAPQELLKRPRQDAQSPWPHGAGGYFWVAALITTEVCDPGTGGVGQGGV